MKKELDPEKDKEPAPEEETAEQETDERSAEIIELQRRNEECLDKMKRLQADFDNYRKRAAKEREEYTQVATARLVMEMLGVVDNFERALANSKGDEQTRKGLKMMYDQLVDVLKREGVTEIKTDCRLDPFQHEVMTKVDDPEREDEEIVECLQKGYKLKDRVIRPARVVVCRKEKMNTGEDDKGESTEKDDTEVHDNTDKEKR